MARITVDIDDALLGAAAHALGTRSGEDTVRAALAAAIGAGTATPPLPRPDPPVPGRPVPGGPVPPPAPGRPDHPSEFPYPPEIH